MENSGYAVTGTETDAGDGLTVSDVTLSVAQENPASRFEMTIDQIDFRENADGTVAIAWPDSMPITLSGTDVDGLPYDLRLSYAHADHAMSAAGTPEDLSYRYTAPGIDLALVSATVAGEALSPDMARLAISLSGVSSDTRMQAGDMRQYGQELAAEVLTFDLAFRDPQTGSDAAVTGQLSGVNFTGTAAVPGTVDLQDVVDTLTAGFAMDGVFTFASGQSRSAVTDPEQDLQVQTRSEGGSFRVAMDQSQLLYDITQTGADIAVTSDQAPFPIEISAAQSGLRLAMPIVKAEAPQDFAMRLMLGDFTVSDALWAVLDPTGALPRDPANLNIDLAGTASVLADFLDPDMAASLAQEDGSPGQIESLKINDLLLSLAGAKLQGDGDFTFENTAPGPVPGLPKPVGALNLKLTGVNGLLDRLIQMGMLTDQDAMGARMMMGMLTVPGEAPDTLSSVIEINAEGHVLANGQRIQ
jgi:hypothetical protein